MAMQVYSPCSKIFMRFLYMPRSICVKYVVFNQNCSNKGSQNSAYYVCTEQLPFVINYVHVVSVVVGMKTPISSLLVTDEEWVYHDTIFWGSVTSQKSVQAYHFFQGEEQRALQMLILIIANHVPCTCLDLSASKMEEQICSSYNQLNNPILTAFKECYCPRKQYCLSM